ncbi:MAG: fibrobacter succinogenes major paralogous domain-containing protein [Bacteroidia bacterium]|nr:fibrobacter succinogenes major paralogous domain-containing protein [Bacteroidia bacterium]
MFTTSKYYRAKVTDGSCSPVYSQARHAMLGTCFTCGTSTVGDYDGNSYNTVQIGSQCWMRENLKTTHYSDGTAMVDGTSAGDITGNYTAKYYFDYNNTPLNTVTYGKLYTWAAVMNGAASSNANPSGVQGVCPTGWHVPSDAEWTQLSNSLGGDSVAGGKMKEVGTTHWNSPNTDADNSSGFTCLPGGNRSQDGTFYSIGNYDYFWSATDCNAAWAWGCYLNYNSAILGRSCAAIGTKAFGFSVRCVRD